MLGWSALLGLAAALATGAPPVGGGGPWRDGLVPPPDLALHAWEIPLDLGPLPGPASDPSSPPPCLGDVCQPRVSVPGYEPRYGRLHRSELFVLALQRAHVEPIATLVWALVATGLRFDYTPVVFDGPNSGGHGWGSVFLRLRLRLGPDNVPVIPQRPR